jgi:leader peptidase (prepilin peptidase)/N-methyltransferase
MRLILFLFGLCIGSFINVVSLRYKPEESPETEGLYRHGAKVFDLKVLGGRSYCPHCKRQLNWYELIPVLSFVFLRGRCRTCHQKISWQYPIVEILSGLIFVFVPWRFSNSQFFNPNFSIFQSFNLSMIILWLLIFELFLLLSIIDFRHYLIPDSINFLLLIFGIFLTILQSFSFSIFQSSFLSHYALLFVPFSGSSGIFKFLGLLSTNIWLNHFIGLLFAAVFFGLIIFLSKGKGMGWGDFKLASALGLIFGWPDILVILVLSFLLGGISGIILMLSRKKHFKEAVPFGPFLVLGATLIFFFGFQIINGYFRLFSL